VVIDISLAELREVGARTQFALFSSSDLLEIILVASKILFWKYLLRFFRI
jgi:hypothetical protein